MENTNPGKTVPTIEERINNMNKLTEQYLRDLLQEFKETSIPSWRRNLLYGYNLVACGALMYFTINSKKFNKPFLKPDSSKSIKKIIGIATLQSVGFCALFCTGFILVSGLWNPIKYLKTYSKIQSYIAGVTLRHEKSLQKNILVETMKSFGVSYELIRKTEEELAENKRKILDEGLVCEDTAKILRGEDKSVWSKMFGWHANQVY